eukprot:2214-Heterococcus_DN1.PRE.9
MPVYAHASRVLSFVFAVASPAEAVSVSSNAGTINQQASNNRIPHQRQAQRARNSHHDVVVIAASRHSSQLHAFQRRWVDAPGSVLSVEWCI